MANRCSSAVIRSLKCFCAIFTINYLILIYVRQPRGGEPLKEPSKYNSKHSPQNTTKLVNLIRLHPVHTSSIPPTKRKQFGWSRISPGKRKLGKMFCQNESFLCIEESYIESRAPLGKSALSISEKKIQFVDSTGEFGQSHLGGCPQLPCRIVDFSSNNNPEHFQPDARIYNQIGERENNFGVKDNVTNIYFNQESPSNFPLADFEIKNSSNRDFQGTLTYRMDSSFPIPYGYIMKRARRIAINYKSITIAKFKGVAWLVSNCVTSSKREDFVSALLHHIPIHISAGCQFGYNATYTPLDCPKEHGSRCDAVIAREYWFYLAFENSLCKDYITEKFWRFAAMDIVPVVLKRKIYEKWAPHDSFIAADDFDSPKMLAAYLRYLMKNRKAYVDNHLRWKERYRAIFLDGSKHDKYEKPWGFCELCRQLLGYPRFAFGGTEGFQSGANLAEWWNTECDYSLVGALLKES